MILREVKNEKEETMTYNDKNVIAKFSMKNYVMLSSFLQELGAVLGDYCRLVIEPHPEGALLIATDGGKETLVVLDKSGFANKTVCFTPDIFDRLAETCKAIDSRSFAAICKAFDNNDIKSKDRSVIVLEDESFSDLDLFLKVGEKIIQRAYVDVTYFNPKEEAFGWHDLVKNAIEEKEQHGDILIAATDIEKYNKIARKLTNTTTISLTAKANAYIIKFHKCDYAIGIISLAEKTKNDEFNNDLSLFQNVRGIR